MRGVATKLRTAFVGVSLFSLLAAVVGIASFEVIERAQEEVLDRSLPAALGAERMAKRGVSIVAATPALLAAKDDKAVLYESARIRLAREEIKRVIPQMRRLGVAEGLLAPIETELSRMFDNLERQVDLVNARNRLATLIGDAAGQAVNEAHLLVEILKPSIVDATARLLAQSDGVRDILLRPGADVGSALEAFEALTDAGFFEVSRLTEMRFRADNIVSQVEAVLLTVSVESIGSIREELNFDIRSLARSALEIREPSLRSKIGGSLQGLSEVLRGPGDLLRMKSELIQTESELERLGLENRESAVQLEIGVDRLTAEVGALIVASTEQARGVVGLGRITLVLIAVLAFVVAIFLTWRYVLKDIAARVRRLAEITRDLSRGNVEVMVDVHGNDELGEMADAVRVFRANATELIRSNEELEQFAYVASHDLKAPLRGVSNLASWIEQDLESAMTEESKEHMGLLKGRIDRMETLLDDLLAFSRVGRKVTEERTVDLSHTVPEIFRLVVPPDRFSLETVGVLPLLVTAAAPLEQVFRNLISNAVKHHDGERGTIEIEAKDLGTEYEFRIRDDGPGIPRQYQERIFGLFQTLRSRDEVEGSGMGLAIVKKIVESVDCRIGVESDPEVSRGTTFRFTWPKRWRRATSIAEAA